MSRHAKLNNIKYALTGGFYLSFFAGMTHVGTEFVKDTTQR